MRVRLGAARLVAVCAMLGGLLVVGATPALADDDSVRVRSASSFDAGGSAGGVNLEVRKRTDGCVLLRTGLVLRLDGVTADQVKVQVAVGGQWWPVPVSGNNALATARTAPANPTLCKGKSVTVKYRVSFAAGVPGGRLTVVGEAVTALGRSVGRAADTSKVVAARATASPSATPSRSSSPTPTPTVAATVPPAATDAAPTLAEVAAGGGAQAAEEAGSLGSVVMISGIAMVAVGIALIVLLFRRSRADKADKLAQGEYAPLPDSSTMLLPGNPGGTTYRSAQPSAGVPGSVPPPNPGTYRSAGAPQPDTGPQTPPPAPGSGPQPPPPAPSGGGDATVIMPRLPR